MKRGLLLAGFATVACVQAQTRAEFEVASVKPAPPDAIDFRFRPPNHGIDASNISLERFIL